MDPERKTKEERELEQAADRLGVHADEMQQRSDQLGEEIDTARQNWRRKRADERVPGANPPESEDEPYTEASFPAKEGDDDEETPASPANP